LSAPDLIINDLKLILGLLDIGLSYVFISE